VQQITKPSFVLEKLLTAFYIIWSAFLFRTIFSLCTQSHSHHPIQKSSQRSLFNRQTSQRHWRGRLQVRWTMQIFVRCH